MKYEPCSLLLLSLFKFFRLSCALAGDYQAAFIMLKIIVFIFPSVNHLTSVFIYHLSLPFSLSLSRSLFVLFSLSPCHSTHSQIHSIIPPCNNKLGGFHRCFRIRDVRFGSWCQDSILLSIPISGDTGPSRARCCAGSCTLTAFPPFDFFTLLFSPFHFSPFHLCLTLVGLVSFFTPSSDSLNE